MVDALRSIRSDPDEAQRRASKAVQDAGRYSFEAHMEKFVREAGPLVGHNPR